MLHFTHEIAIESLTRELQSMLMLEQRSHPGQQALDGKRKLGCFFLVFFAGAV